MGDANCRRAGLQRAQNSRNGSSMKLACALTACAFAALAACVGDDPAITTPDPAPGADAATDTASPPPQDGAVADASTCPQTTCGTACVDLKTSVEHCGACGHTCDNSTCDAGFCKPVLVRDNVAGPVAVTVTAKSVFWLRNGAVERCEAKSCAGPKLITDDPKVPAQNPGGTIMVTDGSFVAWIAGNFGGMQNVYSCGVGGCNGASPKAASGLNDLPTQLAVAGTTLYVTQATGAARGGPMATLAMVGIAGTGNDIPTGLAVDATNLYLAGALSGSDRGTGRVALAGGTLSPLFSDPDGTRLALGGTELVATSTAGIVKCAVAGCGGAPTTLAAADIDTAAIAADAKFAVWAVPGSPTTADGSIRVCALPDCKGGPRTIAAGQAQPVSVTVADGFVYWANKGVMGTPGSIWRAAL